MKKTELRDIIGVIFDFNGTMFFDSDKHIKAWTEYVSDLTGVTPLEKDINKYIVGKSAKDIMEHFLGCEITHDMLEQFTEEKEGVYRMLCDKDREGLHLAKGLPEFLDYLTEYNIPRTIASTASLSNMMYYFERFDLYRWFEPDKVVFHDKRLRDKPYPDMYLVACKLINKEPERCLVFEDSATGITAALNAGVKNIVAVTGDNPHLEVKGFNYIKAAITDFSELNDELEL